MTAMSAEQMPEDPKDTDQLEQWRRDDANAQQEREITRPKPKRTQPAKSKPKRPRRR